MSKELQIRPEYLVILARYINEINLIETILTKPEFKAISLRFGLQNSTQLSTKDVAKIMEMSDTRVRTLIENGMARLKAHRPGKDWQVSRTLTDEHINAYLENAGLPMLPNSQILQDLIYYLLEKKTYSDLMDQITTYFQEHSLPIREELAASPENIGLNRAVLEYISLRQAVYPHPLETSPNFFEWREQIQRYTPNQKLALIVESKADHLLIGALNIGQLVCFVEYYLQKKTPLEIWTEYCKEEDGSERDPRVEVIEEIVTHDLPIIFDIILYYQSMAQALVDSPESPHTWQTIRIDTFIRQFISDHKVTLGLNRVIFTD